MLCMYYYPRGIQPRIVGGPCPVLCTKTILGQETDDEDDDDFFHQYLQEKKYTEANSFISCLMNL